MIGELEGGVGRAGQAYTEVQLAWKNVYVLSISRQCLGGRRSDNCLESLESKCCLLGRAKACKQQAHLGRRALNL